MLKHILKARGARRLVSLTLVFLAIEFFDELIYTVLGAVLPVLRADLALSYAQVGLLLGIPAVTSAVIEPVIMLLGDTGLRKRLILGGGVAVILSLFLMAGAESFLVLLAAMVISYPASGAFVTLSQATLMDLNPGREPHLMARWSAAGSLGSLLGPLLAAAGFALALGWRWAFIALAFLGVGLLFAVLLIRFPSQHENPGSQQDKRSTPAPNLLKNLSKALRNRQLLRWTTLLQFSDLLLDVFTGYVVLYFTDVVGASPAQASLMLTLLMLTGLVGDLVLIRLLEHIPGRLLVRATALVTIGVYTAWLLSPWPAAKVILLVVMSFSTMGWYPVLQGEAFAAAPGQSGAVMAVGSLAGLLGGAVVWGIGWFAEQAGLPAAMWLLLAGPVCLALFTPPAQTEAEVRTPQMTIAGENDA